MTNRNDPPNQGTIREVMYAISDELKRQSGITIFEHNLEEVAKAAIVAWGNASTRKDEGRTGTTAQGDGQSSLNSPTNSWAFRPNHYAGCQPERHISKSSDSVAEAPDRQGDALIAEPPAPNPSEIRGVVDDERACWQLAKHLAHGIQCVRGPDDYLVWKECEQLIAYIDAKICSLLPKPVLSAVTIKKSELIKIVRDAIYNTWHERGISDVDIVATIAVGAINTYLERGVKYD